MTPQLLRSLTLVALLAAQAPAARAQTADAGVPAASAVMVSPTKQSDAATNRDLLELDPSSYTTTNFEWLDQQRNRRVPARLYAASRPAADGDLPLVVFSHGIGGSREGYTYLGRYLAAQGYASLHVQHVGSDSGAVWSGNPFLLVSRMADAAQDREALSRVHDLRFALDQMLASPDVPRIDRSRIAVAGHSYGANTAMLAAGASLQVKGLPVMLKDDRVAAAILLSAPPFYGYGNPLEILSNIRIPTLHITATEDTINIPGYVSGVDDRLAIYDAMGSRHPATKVLAVFKEGSHSVFTDRARTGGTALNPKIKLATRQLALAFLTQVFAGDQSGLRRWQSEHAPLTVRFEIAMQGITSP